jgi:hypothetical protein
MSKLVQMVYISRASMPIASNGGEIGPEVAKILRKSRINNRAKNIVGALYFGNGYFFQCLEGDESTLMALYETLKKDTRHTDLQIISMNTINARSFGDWEMKYLPAEQEVNKLLRSFGMSAFEPYRFDETMTAKMLNLLVKGSNLNLAELNMADKGVDDTVESGLNKCGAWKFSSMALAMLLCVDIAWRVFS